jgi:outer membrane protein TolC
LNRFARTFALVSVGVLLWTAAGAAAQEGPAVPLHLAEATALALNERPELRLEIEKQAIARSKVREARGSFWPTLDLSGSSDYIRNYDTFTGIDISAQIAGQDVTVNIQKEVPAYELNGGLDLVYNLYAGGRDKALLGEAVDNLASAGHQQAVTLRRIRLQVADVYWGLKKAQAQFAMAGRALELARLQIKVAQTEHRVARRSDLAFEESLLTGREKEVALRRADRDCLRAYSSYRDVLGLPEELTAASCEQIPILADDPDPDQCVETPAVEHPQIQQLKSDIQAARERAKAARAENAPQLDLFAKYALIGRDPDAYLDAWRDARSEYYMVGLKLRMNLFNGGRSRERIHQAEGEMRVKRLELTEKERALAQAQQERQAGLESARDALSLALARQDLETARQQVAKSRLQSGRISELEYRQTEMNAEDAADRAAIAKIDVALAANAVALMVLQ